MTTTVEIKNIGPMNIEVEVYDPEGQPKEESKGEIVHPGEAITKYVYKNQAIAIREII